MLRTHTTLSRSLSRRILISLQRTEEKHKTTNPSKSRLGHVAWNGWKRLKRLHRAAPGEDRELRARARPLVTKAS